MHIEILEKLASYVIGDGNEPNIFFVTTCGNVCLITVDGLLAYNYWRNLPRNVESSLEDRLTGYVCTVKPVEEDSKKLITRDDFRRFFPML